MAYKYDENGKRVEIINEVKSSEPKWELIKDFDELGPIAQNAFKISTPKGETIVCNIEQTYIESGKFAVFVDGDLKHKYNNRNEMINSLRMSSFFPQEDELSKLMKDYADQYSKVLQSFLDNVKVK
jgi:hypothetical protein